MFPQHGIVRALLGLALFAGFSGNSHGQIIFFEDFNSYSVASPLPLGAKWSVASNDPPLQTSTVEQDSANVFGEGNANLYLKMVSLAAPAVYTLSDATLSSGSIVGSIQFSFFEPTDASSHGEGFILRVENNASGNTATAFGFGLKRGGLYLATGGSVNLTSTAFASYPLDQKHALAVYFNNSQDASQYEMGGMTYSLPSGTMDVWLDGARVGIGLGKCGGIGLGVPITKFNFTTKTGYSGTLYVDDVIQKSAASPAFLEPFSAYVAGTGLPSGGQWSSVTNTAPFQAMVQADTGNLFGNGVSNCFLKMGVTADTTSTYLVKSAPFGPGMVASNASFEFYQPSSPTCHGDGFLVQTGSDSGGTMVPAFGLAVKNGSLYLVSGTTMSLAASPFSTYSLNQKHSLQIFANNSKVGIYYYSTGTGNYGVAAGSMDVWLDGARVGTGLGSIGLLSPDGGMNDFNFTSKVNFVGTLYVDDMAVNSAGTFSFVEDWNADPAKGKWASVQVKSSDRLAKDPVNPTWHGSSAARVEVESGDTVASGERSEVAYMSKLGQGSQQESPSSGTVYYAMSYKLPADWQSSAVGAAGWSIVLQLHGPNDLEASPSIALLAEAQYQMFLNGGDLDSAGVGAKVSAYAQTYNFSDGSLNLGNWTDFVIRVTYALSPSGRVTVWRRNQGAAIFTQVMDQLNVRTLQSRGALGGSHYWKRGLYRNPWDKTNVLYMGPLARGTTFDAVEWRAFGTTVGAP